MPFGFYIKTEKVVGLVFQVVENRNYLNSLYSI